MIDSSVPISGLEWIIVFVSINSFCVWPRSHRDNLTQHTHKYPLRYPCQEMGPGLTPPPLPLMAHTGTDQEPGRKGGRGGTLMMTCDLFLRSLSERVIHGGV